MVSTEVVGCGKIWTPPYSILHARYVVDPPEPRTRFSAQSEATNIFVGSTPDLPRLPEQCRQMSPDTTNALWTQRRPELDRGLFRLLLGSMRGADKEIPG